MSNIMVVGYHGMKNFGDDLFLLNFVNSIYKNDGGTLYVTAYFSGENMPNYKFVKGIYKSRNRVTRLDWLRQVICARKCDQVYYYAGSIFATNGGMYTYLACCIIRKFLNIPIYAIGVSIGPFNSKMSEYFYTKALSFMNALVVRDIPSYERALLAGCKNVYISPDHAALFENITSTDSAREMISSEFTIGIALGPGYKNMTSRSRDADAFLVSETIADVVCLQKALIDQGLKPNVIIYVTCTDLTDGDAKVAVCVRDTLSSTGLSIDIVNYENYHVDDFVRELKRSNVLISSRMHPSVVCMANGIPVFQLKATSEKIHAVFSSLNLHPKFITNGYRIPFDVLSDFVKDFLAGNFSKDSVNNPAKFAESKQFAHDVLCNVLR